MQIAGMSTTEGPAFSLERFRAKNRTGAALVKGQVAAMNISGADTTYDEWDPATPGTYVPYNLVAVQNDTSNHSGLTMVAYALKDIAADEVGVFALSGLYVEVYVSGTVSGVGEFLTVTNDSAALTPLTRAELIALGTSLTAVVGVALETRTGAGTVKALFSGYAFTQLFATAAS
jgi:predicted anti-sigma-YlaC factor YlaD